MNIAMLRTLAAIVERGSFAAAAQHVGCTPSAVSLQVKQLEAWFGRPLFDRSGRSVRPTELAHEAARVGRELGERLSSLRARARTGVGGEVRLGAIATVQADALPRALRSLRDRHRALEVRVTLGDSSELLDALKAGRIEAAVLVRPASGGSSRLHWHELARQPYVMLLPPGETGASPREIVERHGLIAYDPALTGGRIAAAYVRKAFPRAHRTMEVRSIDVIVAMVAAGLGVSIVPRPRAALLAAHDVRALGLGRHAPTRRIAFACRQADAENRNLAAVRIAFADAYRR